ELGDDIRNCTLVAPHDGMVVYKISEQSRSGTGSQKGILAVGEPVYESKTLLSIPDLRHMQARLKVHESLQPRVRPDKVRKTRQGDCLIVGMAFGSPGPGLLGALLAAPEILEVAAEAGIIQERVLIKAGHPAEIRVSSLDHPLRGQVSWMATVASQLDAI